MAFQLVNFNLIITDIYAKIKKLLQRLSGVESSVAALESAPPVADGNGVYDGSGTSPQGTLVTMTKDLAGTKLDFGIGTFPNWPDWFYDGNESGFYWGDAYMNGGGLISKYTYMEIIDGRFRVSVLPSIPGPQPSHNFQLTGTTASWEYNHPTNGGSRISLVSAGIGYNAIQLGTNNVRIIEGTGSPNGAVTASPGCIYLNRAGGAGATFWIKESGSNTNTGWVAK